MRILFFGITQFGTSGLRKLIERGTPPVGLVVAPFFSQDIENMKLIAREHQIPVFAPTSPNAPDVIESFRLLKPDVIVTYTYHKRLGADLLGLAKHVYNMHPSLLPYYRGNNPYFWTVANGESETGVTFHVLSDRFDEGDIILQERVPIHTHDTCGMVINRQEPLAAEMLDQLLKMVESDTPVPRTPQPSGSFKLAPKPTIQDHFIHWSWPTQKILDRIRAVNPFSGAYAQYKQDVLAIYDAQTIPFDSAEPAGTVAMLTPEGPLIKTGDGGIVLKIVMVGKKYLLTGNDFIEHENVILGDTFTAWE